MYPEAPSRSADLARPPSGFNRQRGCLGCADDGSHSPAKTRHTTEARTNSPTPTKNCGHAVHESATSKNTRPSTAGQAASHLRLRIRHTPSVVEVHIARSGAITLSHASVKQCPQTRRADRSGSSAPRMSGPLQDRVRRHQRGSIRRNGAGSFPVYASSFVTRQPPTQISDRWWRQRVRDDAATLP
jgi:hypothetical protein